MKLFTPFLFLFLVFNLSVHAQESYVTSVASEYSFPLIVNAQVATLVVSDTDWPGVKRVAGHLQQDITAVSGIKPMLNAEITAGIDQVIIGTLGKSKLIDSLVITGKLDEQLLKGKWEKFITTIIDNPVPGVARALVIAGSDKRGTIYGMYELSRQMGVSPWYFWADVPIEKKEAVYVLPGLHTAGEPKVKYRGIFINDEAPALTDWVSENYGSFNAKFYDNVFELILRLKGNYIWPAMWGKMFYVEDENNAKLADEYGIVMGTSHHEPLTRAHSEWGRFGDGDWDFSKNAENLKSFWKEGMQRKGDTEALVTVGMRGDGDEPMTEGTAIELLENIVAEQRKIIAEVTGKPTEETPQMWALYKEVQDYYDKGMRVPDDITLLLCDDNWGNIRKLPELTASPRSGGYGIYYHFDYVGGPRNYKWINTTQIERTWEQMHLAYEYGADRVWIVNVGDLKPMEFPISFFLDYAWDPEAIDASNLPDYYIAFAKENFGSNHTPAIAEMLKKYTKYNARRKPEMIDSTTYSVTHYNEADRVVTEYNELAQEAVQIGQELPKKYFDAYYQLVQFPIEASANLNALHVAAAKNQLYAKQGRAIANTYADEVKTLFEKDAALADFYHHTMADGKWNHMVSQTHIGYTYWQQPDKNTIPTTHRVELPQKGKLGIAVPNATKTLTENGTIDLPKIYSLGENHQNLTLFNTGSTSIPYKLKAEAKWIILDTKKGIVGTEKTIKVAVNLDKLPLGKSEAPITIAANNNTYTVMVFAEKQSASSIHGFIEMNGGVSMEADHFSRSVNQTPYKWVVVDNLGKTGSSVMASPQFIGPIAITSESPRLEYDVFLESKGAIKVHAYFAPTINYTMRDGLKYGIGFDDEIPQVMNLNEDNSGQNWNISVGNNIKIISSTHTLTNAGNHTLKFYMKDSGLVLQKIVIETTGFEESYLGSPESFKQN